MSLCPALPGWDLPTVPGKQEDTTEVTTGSTTVCWAKELPPINVTYPGPGGNKGCRAKGENLFPSDLFYT